MKLNIVTILLFTLLLSTGFSTKSSAQEWRWRRHCYAGCMSDTASERNFGHWGYRGCEPRRYYRHMMCSDTAMCHGWCGRPYRWNRWESYKEVEANYEKYDKEMEAKWKSYHDDMMKEEKDFHGGLDKWDNEYRWHRWHRNRYYYRGGGY